MPQTRLERPSDGPAADPGLGRVRQFQVFFLEQSLEGIEIYHALD